jgi:nitric oxide reductase NorD protein
MAEAEDVLQDAARHATIFVRDLWRRHRPTASRVDGLALRDVSRRLDLLAHAVFGRAFALRQADPPAPATLLDKLFRRGEGVRVQHALPATDGHTIWLPATLPFGRDPADITPYRLALLQQAMRAVRGSAEVWSSLSHPVEQALFLVLEADAADAALARMLPGVAADLHSRRQHALSARPPLATLPAHRQPLEAVVRRILAQPMSQTQPMSVETVLRHARHEARALPDVPPGRLLYRDLWTGEFRRPATAAPMRAGDPQAETPSPTPARSARLPRSPTVREAPENEDDTRQGAWMVQTAQPHEQAEDPIGMQRPTDRDDATAAEEFADALSELPQARLVATPSRPKEVLLSEDLPASRSKAALPDRAPGTTGRHRYPEWDYRRQAYVEGAVTVHVSDAPEGPQAWVDATLAQNRALLHLVRRRFEMLQAQRLRLYRQLDGEEPDLNACVEAWADLRAGRPMPTHLYQTVRPARRDMAVLILTDVSGSTDGWLSAHRRVIDVEREALLLVSRALESMRERHALQAFSGEGPHGVVVRVLKDFDEQRSDLVARRIASLEPEHNTRAGAALRHATATLMQQPAHHRLLLLLSDGKPNDIDDYEGRYGVEDMRQATTEARLQGIHPFCLTVDRQAATYLPQVFGPHHYAMLPRPERLPVVLLEWMKRLAASG